MAIKIKYQDPKSTDFGPNDIVINSTNGTIFYKSEKGMFKLQGDNLNTTTDLIHFSSSISATKGFFKSPGIGELMIEKGVGIYKFIIGHRPTVEVGGNIMPSDSDAPSYDLGSPKNPFRHLYVGPQSIIYIKTGKGVGFSQVENGFKIEEYKEFTDPNPATKHTNLSKENIDDLKSGKSIVSESKDIIATGEAEKVDGITNYIRPEVIYHPTDDESAIIHKTIGRLSYRSPGGDPLDIFCAVAFGPL